jgi:hypothetical protein
MWISSNDGSEVTKALFVEVLNQQNAMVTLNKWGLQPTEKRGCAAACGAMDAKTWWN